MYDVLKILLDRLMEQERRLEAEWQMRIFTEQSKCSSNSAADVVALIECVAAPSKKIDAIKLYGKITGIGLKESKDAIERITHQFTDQQAVFDSEGADVAEAFIEESRKARKVVDIQDIMNAIRKSEQ